MKEKYSLKYAFDNRYKNYMILNIFMILGFCLVLMVDVNLGHAKYILDYIFLIVIVVLFCLYMTLKRYIVYRHIKKHGTMYNDLNYRIVKDKNKKAEVVVRYPFNDRVNEIKSNRYHIEDKSVGKKGKVNVIIDLQHPKYYYIFYK